MFFLQEILSTEEKKKIYDKHGLKGLQEGTGPDHSDIFSHLFGGFFGGAGGGGGSSRQQQCEPIVLQLTVTLEDFYNGGLEIKRTVDRIFMCGTCSGKGGKPGMNPRRCKGCHGTGMKVTIQHIGGEFQNL